MLLACHSFQTPEDPPSLVGHLNTQTVTVQYICTNFGTDYDVKFNDTKSVAMRIGPRFNAVCKSLQLAGNCLQVVDSVKYLGVCSLASRYLRCSFEDAKMKFFSCFELYFCKEQY